MGVGYFYTLGNRDGGGVISESLFICLLLVWGWVIFIPWVTEMGGGVISELLFVYLLLVWGWVIFIPWVTEMGGGGISELLFVGPSIHLPVHSALLQKMSSDL